MQKDSSLSFEIEPELKFLECAAKQTDSYSSSDENNEVEDATEFEVEEKDCVDCKVTDDEDGNIDSDEFAVLSENHDDIMQRTDVNFVQSKLIKESIESVYCSHTVDCDENESSLNSPYISQACSPYPTPRPLKAFSMDSLKEPLPQHLFDKPADSSIHILHQNVSNDAVATDGCAVSMVDMACSPIVSQLTFESTDSDSDEDEDCKELCEIEESMRVIPVIITQHRMKESEDANEMFISEGLNLSHCLDDVCNVVSDEEDVAQQHCCSIGTEMTPAKLLFENDENKEDKTECESDDPGTSKMANGGETACTQITGALEQLDMKSEMVAIATQDCGTECTPIKMFTIGCDTVAVVMETKQTSPLLLPQTADVTPPRLVTTATSYTPLVTTAAACATSPLLTADVGTVTMDRLHCQESVTTMVTPIKLSDGNVGTVAILTCDTDTSVTPVKLSEMSTSMTPLQFRQTNLYSMVYIDLIIFNLNEHACG